MSHGESSLRYAGWRVAGASAVGVFFASLLAYGFGVLLKPLSEEFAWSRETTAGAYSTLALAMALAAPVVGRLLDRYGPVRVVVPCIALIGLGIASLSMLTASRVHLHLLFFTLGLAAIGTSPLAYSRAIVTWFDRRRGMALAIMIGGAAAGSIVHPPAVSALIGVMHWRQACLVLGAIVLAVGVPIVIGLVRERDRSTREPRLTVGGATVRGAWRSWILWVLLVVVAGASVAFNGVVVHLVALLTDRGVTAPRAAMALSLLGGFGLIGRLITGWMIDRVRATYVSAGLLALAAAGIVLLASTQSFEVSLAAVAMIGFGMGGELDITPFLLSRYFGLRSLATLYGFAWTATGAGASAGSVLMGRAFDATGSYDRMLLQLAVATMFVAVLMLMLPAYRVSGTLFAGVESNGHGGAESTERA